MTAILFKQALMLSAALLHTEHESLYIKVWQNMLHDSCWTFFALSESERILKII